MRRTIPILCLALAVIAADSPTFKIQPVRPVEELRGEALRAQPPVETGDFRADDLVELIRLDSSIKLDLRYATTDNFLSSKMYTQARAFMQRPAAEAVVRAHRKLGEQGLGLLIYDAYRPWYVTKIFRDATPPDKHSFVADPMKGSKHNRGCAVDLTIYDRRTGKAIPMPSGFDEFSERAHPSYSGGTTEERSNREQLRRTMEAEGFTIDGGEWWHYDFKDWRLYRIGNIRFEKIP